MPEVVTRYPEVLIKELKDAKGKCGVGHPQIILKKCPADRFCALPTGEICVYDLQNVSSMTQVSRADWSEAITGVPGMYTSTNLIIVVLVFGIGLVVGMWLKKLK